jgi:hypothetical protein
MATRSCHAFSLEVLAGYGAAYEYPIDPTGERAVPSSSSKFGFAVSAARRIDARFEVVGGFDYLRFSGNVALPKVPEAPDRRVAGSSVAASIGLRCSTPRDRATHLYVELAPAAVILHTSVDERDVMTRSWVKDESSTDIAPGVALGAGVVARIDDPWSGGPGRVVLGFGGIREHGSSPRTLRLRRNPQRISHGRAAVRQSLIRQSLIPVRRWCRARSAARRRDLREFPASGIATS